MKRKMQFIGIALLLSLSVLIPVCAETSVDPNELNTAEPVEEVIQAENQPELLTTENITEEESVLEIQPFATFPISCRILDEDDHVTPIPNINVNLYRLVFKNGATTIDEIWDLSFDNDAPLTDYYDLVLLRDDLVTDSDGRITDSVPAGYYAWIIQGPFDYYLPDTFVDMFEVGITNSASDYNVNLLKLFVDLKIVKTDSVTGAPLEGATFHVTGAFQGVEHDFTVTTDSNGVALIPRIYFYTVYSIEEITAPTGYVLDSTIQTVSVRGPNKYYDDPIVAVNLINQQQFQVTYHSNCGGDPTTANVPGGVFTYGYGDTVTVHPTPPTRDNYTFLGWKAVEGTGTRSIIDQSVNPGDTFEIYHHIEFHAQWEENVVNPTTPPTTPEGPKTPVEENPTPTVSVPKTGVTTTAVGYQISFVVGALFLLIVLRKKKAIQN